MVYMATDIRYSTDWFWDSPLGQALDSYEDRDAQRWVWGLNLEQSHALVLTPSCVFVASVEGTSLGDLYARREHFDAHRQAQAAKDYPIRV